MTEVAVTGANGFVGGYVQSELASRGFHVRGLVRSLGRITDAQSTSQFVEVDYEAAPSILAGLDGAEAIVHLLGHAHQSDPDESVYERVNVGYTRRVIEAAAKSGVRRFVFLSSIKALGNGDAEPYSEKTVPKPEDPYGRSKLEAEIAVRTLAQSAGIDHVILRPPLVYGAGVKGNLAKLIAAIERGWPIPVVRSAANVRSLISARNLASAIGETLSWSGPINETYHVSDREDLSMPELVDLIARVGGGHARKVPVPPGLLRALAKAAHRETVSDRFMRSLRVDATLFTTRFGWRPIQTLEDGLREAVGGFRSGGRGV